MSHPTDQAPPARIDSRTWWSFVGTRAVRQALQTLLPTALAIAGGHLTGINATGVAVAAAVTALVVVLRALSGLRVRQHASVLAQALDRAVAAAAGTALGLVTAAAFTPLSWDSWEAVLISSAGSAAAALLMWAGAPPVPETSTTANALQLQRAA